MEKQGNNMKKQIIMLCSSLVFFIVLASFIVVILNPQSLVTGRVDDVYEITISRDETLITLSQSNADSLFEKLRGMAIKVNKHPTHDSIQHAPKYTIQVQYKNGNKDVIQTTECVCFLFRFIGSDNLNGDRAYVISKEREDFTSILECYFQ